MNPYQYRGPGFLDMRNAVGFLYDVISREHPDETSGKYAELIREFVRSPSTVIMGHHRKGHRRLYQDVRRVLADVHADHAWWDVGVLIQKSMDTPDTTWSPNDWWFADRYLPMSDLVNLEIEWRFKDFTRRRRKHRYLKNAFRALWLAGAWEDAARLAQKGEL